MGKKMDIWARREQELARAEELRAQMKKVLKNKEELLGRTLGMYLGREDGSITLEREEKLDKEVVYKVRAVEKELKAIAIEMGPEVFERTWGEIDMELMMERREKSASERRI